jgi:hypothetical protein
VNKVTGKSEMPEGEGWRTPDCSWLDMKGEDKDKVFHVNVVM